MSLLAFFGSVLLAYGMPVTFIVGYVSRRALLLLFATAAAFAWIAVALLAGAVWAAARPLQDVSDKSSDALRTHPSGAFFLPLFAILVEIARVSFAWLYLRVEPSLLRMLRRDDPMVLNDLGAALAAGAGFALMAAVVTHGKMVGESWRQEARYGEGCDEISLSSLAAGQAALGFPLHVSLSVVVFDGARRVWGMAASHGGATGGWVRLVAVLVLHLIASLVSLMNGAGQGACVGSLPLQAVVVLVSVGLAVWACMQEDYGPRVQARAAGVGREGAGGGHRQVEGGSVGRDTRA